MQPAIAIQEKKHRDQRSTRQQKFEQEVGSKASRDSAQHLESSFDLVHLRYLFVRSRPRTAGPFIDSSNGRAPNRQRRAVTASRESVRKSTHSLPRLRGRVRVGG